jgi:hypothetical protein
MADYRNVAAAQPYRGIRDNNPGNLESGIGWLGVVGTDNTGLTAGQPGFAIFSDSVYGLRALGTDLMTKMTVDGLTTITAIISAYAPPSGNDTAAYISSVAGDTGLDPNAIITLDTNTLASLIRAIVNHEEGDGPSQQFVSDTDIATGISMMSITNLNALASGTPPPSPDPAAAAILLLVGVVALSMFLNR